MIIFVYFITCFKRNQPVYWTWKNTWSRFTETMYAISFHLVRWQVSCYSLLNVDGLSWNKHNTLNQNILILSWQQAVELIGIFFCKQYNLPAFIFLVALTCLPTWSSYVISRASAKGGNAVFLSQILNGHIQGWSLSISTDSTWFFLTSTFLVVSTNKHFIFDMLLEMMTVKICGLVNISNKMKLF